MNLNRSGKEIEVLDVGCGSTPKGDVNLDLYPEKTEHRDFKTEINTKLVPNFVLGDALHLPFRTNSFETVHSRHVIEHVSDPSLFIKEAMRVARKKVEIIAPHRYKRNKLKLHQSKSHRHFYNVKWFQKALRKLRKEIKLTTRSFPHTLLPIIGWLDEIIVTIYL